MIEHETDVTPEERVAALTRFAARCADALLVVQSQARQTVLTDATWHGEWSTEGAREQQH